MSVNTFMCLFRAYTKTAHLVEKGKGLGRIRKHAFYKWMLDLFLNNSSRSLIYKDPKSDDGFLNTPMNDSE